MDRSAYKINFEGGIVPMYIASKGETRIFIALSQ